MNRTTISNAVRAALAFVMGGKRGNGFVGTIGATRPGEIAQPPSTEAVKRLLEKYHAADAAPAQDAETAAAELYRAARRTMGAEISLERAKREIAYNKERQQIIETLTPDTQERESEFKGVTVQEYNWGAYFYGSRAALERAKLIAPKQRPHQEKPYSLPLNHQEGYRDACYGPNYGKIPPCWKATFWPEAVGKSRFVVQVRFDYTSEDIGQRAGRALAALSHPEADALPREFHAWREMIADLIRAIPPVPLSEALPEQIEAAKQYGKPKKKA